jgi:hypothetical protein
MAAIYQGTIAPGPLDHLKEIIPCGYKMLVNMGWKENTPLGNREKGILEPISQSIVSRLNGDVRGIGYEDKHSFEEREKGVRVRITKMGNKFGVGSSEYGSIFIPKGAAHHLTNLTGLFGKNMLGLAFIAAIDQSEGTFNWRVASISDVVYEKSLIRFVGYYPTLPGNSDFNYEPGESIFDQCFA